MKLRKLGLLAAFIAVAASFAAIGFKPESASAQAAQTYFPKVSCTPGTVDSSPCVAVITIGNPPNNTQTIGAGGDTLTIQITDASGNVIGGVNARFASAAAKTGGTCSAGMTNTLNTAFQQVLVIGGSCGNGSTLIVSFNIAATGPLGTTGSQPAIGGGSVCFKFFGATGTGATTCATDSRDQTGATPFVVPGASNLVAVANCAQPSGLVFAFPSASNPQLTSTTGYPSAIPGQISLPQGSVLYTGQTPQAVSILPRALVGTVTPVVPGGTFACAGVIEVSSINGTLIDASGRVTTNLRITCGDPIVVVFTGQGISPNTCNGVNFAVIGNGVGFVEIRARYMAGNYGLGNPGLNAAFYPCFPGVNGAFTAVGPNFVNTANVTTTAGLPVPCILDREASTVVAFVAPAITVNLGLNPNPLRVGDTGVATARFNRDFQFCDSARVNYCVDPTTGQPLREQGGSTLNGTVIFTTEDPTIITFQFAQPSVNTNNNQVPGSIAAAPSSTFPGGVQGGFQTNANQSVARCGFFPTATTPYGGTPGTRAFSDFFGGCDSVTVNARAVAAGTTNIVATFIPDLPNAYQQNAAGIQAPNLVPVTNGYLAGSNTTAIFDRKAWEVVGVSAVGDVQLVRGCNNVSPTVSESITAYAARVNPSGILISIWEHQPANNTFRGFSPQPGAPSDLAAVTRLRPVFICTNGAGTLAQPAA